VPDLDLDEADRCPHCGKILRDPPNCCEKLIADHEEITTKGGEEHETEFFMKLGHFVHAVRSDVVREDFLNRKV